MHEFSVVQGIVATVVASAEQAGATKVLSVTLQIGDMSELVEEPMMFAWDVLTDEHEITRGAQLLVKKVSPHSVCLDCGAEFDHDRFHRRCPKCDSPATSVISGRELDIASIDVDIPEE